MVNPVVEDVLRGAFVTSEVGLEWVGMSFLRRFMANEVKVR